MSFIVFLYVLILALAHDAWCSPLNPLAERATLITCVSELKKTYDYVVIGGGTSGLTVANRLTEDNKSISARGCCPISLLIPLSIQ